MKDRPSLLGVILAGGMSRRMGGNDKFLENLDGKTIFNHITECILPQVDKVVFNHNKPIDITQIEVVSDIIPEAGPLGGIHAGLSYAKENNFEYIVTVPCDTPFIPTDFVVRLSKSQDTPLVIAGSNDRIHPVLALWHVSLLNEVETSLNKGDFKLMALIKNIDHKVVNWCGYPDPFFNINTPDDLRYAKEVVLKGQ